MVNNMGFIRVKWVHCINKKGMGDKRMLENRHRLNGLFFHIGIQTAATHRDSKLNCLSFLQKQ